MSKKQVEQLEQLGQQEDAAALCNYAESALGDLLGVPGAREHDPAPGATGLAFEYPGVASLATARRIVGDDPIAQVRAVLRGVELAAREWGGSTKPEREEDLGRASRAVADSVLGRWRAKARRRRARAAV